MASLHRHPILAAALALAPFAAPAPAQGAGSTVSYLEWSEDESRRLFESADRNRDDRLDIFESAMALQLVQSHRSIGDFRRLDNSRDGYIDWPEFDRLFQLVVDQREPFAVRLWHPIDAAPTAAPSTQNERVLASIDSDGDGVASVEELRGVLEQFGVAHLIGLFPIIDIDNSGGLDAREFSGVADKIPGLTSLAPATKKGTIPADLDGDGVVDAGELGRSLRLLDPGLARWAPRILANADRNKDRKLDPTEMGLQPVETAKAK